MHSRYVELSHSGDEGPYLCHVESSIPMLIGWQYPFKYRHAGNVTITK
jgi:hypothetical protein